MSTWTTPESARDRLRGRWDNGFYLQALAAGEPFEPIDRKITGPKTAELNSRRSEVADWVKLWHEQAGRPETTVDYRTAGGKGLVGKHQIPDRLRISSLADLERFLGTATQTRRYTRILEHAGTVPTIRTWVGRRPMRALDHYDHFPQLVAALEWIATNAGSGRHLREIDAAGVDTKFIEQHQRMMLELGGKVVPEDLVDPAQSTIAGRFGFAVPGRRVRLRRLDNTIPWPMPGFDDVEVRTEDLAQIRLDVDSVYVVENLTTYLSFPSVQRSVIVFGGGYAAAVLGAIPWLTEVDVRYWGDLDTHGLAILDRLRSTLPDVRSVLMDQDALLEHRAMWGTEPSQVTRELRNLTAAEAACHRALVDDVHGSSLRLEQERIPMNALLTELP